VNHSGSPVTLQIRAGLTTVVELLAYGVALFALLAAWAALDHFAFDDGWTGPTRTAARAAAFGLPVLVMAALRGSWRVGFLAGAAVLLTDFLAAAVNGELECFLQTYLPSNVDTWYVGYEYWSPPLAAIIGLLAHNLFPARRAASGLWPT
jgi:hypothetical protein